MGIRFTANTWRAPLQIIDSWLPAPTINQRAKSVEKAVRLFTSGGWLGRRDPRPTSQTNAVEASASSIATRPRRLRVISSNNTASNHRTEARLVISGHINDVCAELDRLAALEHPSLHKRA
jgi:hypothetical protein